MAFWTEADGGAPQQDINHAAWDMLVRHQQRFARPASDQELAESLQQLDAEGWRDALSGKSVLCLAAGGGRQGPLYALAGAQVTVVDICAAQLELDREVAARRKLRLRTVQTSMDNLSMFDTGQFQLVIHPVSTCYLADVEPAYRQIARVTAAGGLYVSQHKQPASLQADIKASPRGYELIEPYYRDGPLPPVSSSLHREAGTLEYLHRWEQLLGGICHAGFVIEDITEPRHARPDANVESFAHRSCYVAPYVRVRARRHAASATSPRLWMPE